MSFKVTVTVETDGDNCKNSCPFILCDDDGSWWCLLHPNNLRTELKEKAYEKARLPYCLQKEREAI